MELAVQRYPNAKNTDPQSGSKLDRHEKLLFLHGMGGTGAIWRPIAANLENEFDILAPDQRGHGASQIPHVSGARTSVGYTPLDYGKDLVDTLGKLAFYPTWVIGHSMGVRSACALAHLKPDWVKGLVLIDLGFSGAAGGGLGDGLAQFLRKLPTRFSSRAEARDFMSRECPDPSIAQYLMAVSMPDPSTVPAGMRFPFDHSALIQTIEAARDSSVSEWVREMGEAGKPILVLRGKKSLVWSHEEFLAEQTRFAKYPSITFEEMEGTGHGLPFEKRIEFIARLRTFVQKS